MLTYGKEGGRGAIVVVGKEPSLKPTGDRNKMHGNKTFAPKYLQFLCSKLLSPTKVNYSPIQSLKMRNDVNTFKIMSTLGDRKYASDEWSSKSSISQRQQVPFRVLVI